MLPQSLLADQDTEEEPTEEATIEEQEEEGDFLEDFPEETEVGVAMFSCANHPEVLRLLGSRACPCSHWITYRTPATTICKPLEKTLPAPELHFGLGPRGVSSTHAIGGIGLVR